MTQPESEISEIRTDKRRFDSRIKYPQNTLLEVLDVNSCLLAVSSPDSRTMTLPTLPVAQFLLPCDYEATRGVSFCLS